MSVRLEKKTKIVATISDKNCGVDFLTELYHNGLSVVRLNTAHQTPEQSMKVVINVREVSPKIALMIDTKGPEVRTLARPEPLIVTEGDIVPFSGNPALIDSTGVTLSYDKFVDEVSIGQAILIDDGAHIFEVIDKKEGVLLCEAKNDSIVESKKSVNTPNLTLTLPALTDKDREFVNWAADNDIDFIAHSFVRNQNDLVEIQEILDSKKSLCKIISKIENQEGVDNIDSILDNCYGIMVARGDLAVEVPRERIPRIQKELIKTCVARRKPVIVATQMLHTMIENSTPTRAEVSDVANAIYDGADAIMLSGETAYGKYPVESVKMMRTIAVEVEKSDSDLAPAEPYVLNTIVSAHLCKSAVELAEDLDAVAIIADTKHGRTVRNMAAFRGKRPILALCYDARTMRELALSYGAFTFSIDPSHGDTDLFLRLAVHELAAKYSFHKDDSLVIVAGNHKTTVGASYLKVGTVEHVGATLVN